MALSTWAHMVNGYTPKEAFMKITSTGMPSDSDIDSFIRLYIFENIPYFIIEKTLIFDKIRQKIAENLEINDTDIKLTGSAKLGFSLNPKQWLKDYSHDSSDLDFFIISNKLYNILMQDINDWRNNICNANERDLFARIEKNAERGFIDTWHIPRRHKNTDKCANSMYNACLNINTLAGRKIVPTNGKSASIRCYKDNAAAIKQIKLNINAALKKATS